MREIHKKTGKECDKVRKESKKWKISSDCGTKHWKKVQKMIVIWIQKISENQKNNLKHTKNQWKKLFEVIFENLIESNQKNLKKSQKHQKFWRSFEMKICDI